MKKSYEKIEITLKTIVQRDPNQDFSMIDDEVVMLSIENGEYYLLNEVASRIWQIIKNPIRVSEVLSKLLEEYSVSSHTCETETFECLNDFYKKGLIK